jgi:hypothetical protein
MAVAPGTITSRADLRRCGAARARAWGGGEGGGGGGGREGGGRGGGRAAVIQGRRGGCFAYTSRSISKKNLGPSVS